MRASAFSLSSIFILLLSVSGCSWLGWAGLGADSSTVEQASSEIAISEETASLPLAEPPIRVEIEQAFVESETLHLKVSLQAKKDMAPEQMLLIASGLKNGEIQEEQVRLVADELTEPILEEGAKLAFHFELAAAGLTEYQLRYSWGDEAREIAKSKNIIKTPPVPTPAPAVAPLTNSKEENPRAKLAQELTKSDPLKPKNISSEPARLKLIDVEIQKQSVQCVKAPCDSFYVVSATVHNVGAGTSKGVELGLGIYWQNAGSKLVVPDEGEQIGGNEERISLSSLNLQSGQKKKVRVRVDRAVPEVPGGKFVPHLRILPAN